MDSVDRDGMPTTRELKRGTPNPPSARQNLRGIALRVLLLLADETSFGRVPRPSNLPISHRR
jgi:hypothetical protein